MDLPKKVFVSYKYSDVVEGRENEFNFRDGLIDILGDRGLLHKGEDDESLDLSDYNESQIIDKIAPYIKNSSITVVLITPNAKESKWIPWEISMSLRERTYKYERKMTRNGVIGIYLPLNTQNIPDYCGSYDFYREIRPCGTRLNYTDILPEIIEDNRLNLINGSYICSQGCCENVYSSEEGSYIELVEWHDFVANMNKYIERAWNRSEHFENYDTRIRLKESERAGV